MECVMAILEEARISFSLLGQKSLPNLLIEMGILS